MPFTFAHPAIVLPLLKLSKKWFSITGLIIGSLAPDFEYFIRMRVHSIYSHKLSGLFWFDIPLGVLLAFIFHVIVRNTLIDNLPPFLKNRFLIYKAIDWSRYFKNNYLIVIYSILIGAASHLFWDSFTHEHGYFVQKMPFLLNKIQITSLQIPLFKILQHVSTFVGGVIILFYSWKLPIYKNSDKMMNFTYWISILGISFFIITIRLLISLDYHLYGHVIATSISAVLIALIIASLLIKTQKSND